MRRHRCDCVAQARQVPSVMRLSSRCTRIPSKSDSFSRTGALPLSPSHLGQRPRERRAAPHARARFNLSSREMDQVSRSVRRNEREHGRPQALSSVQRFIRGSIASEHPLKLANDGTGQPPFNGDKDPISARCPVGPERHRPR